MPTVKLQASVKRHDAGEKSFFEVTLSNPSNHIALMAHLQLRRNSSGARVLPVYYSDNYISMVPQESKTLTIEAATADLHGELPLLVLDGWNVDVTPVASVDCEIAPNKNALVASWPVTGIPIKWFNGPLSQLKMCCGTRGGSGELKDFSSDAGYDAGSSFSPRNTVIEPGETSSLPLGVFKSARIGECTYSFPMKPAAAGYTIRLAFAEIGFNPKARPNATTATAPATEATTAPAPPQPDLTGKRIFNVQINGTPVLKNFDIFATAHGRNKPVVLEFKAIQPSKDGNITLYFQPGPAEQPLINGIEILPSR